MLHLQLDPHNGSPVYRQMMDQVKYYIASGALKPGTQLPSIRELARRLSVNPTTVVKAYNELRHEGVIELEHGKGAFVAESAARMPRTEREKELRRVARQLAVEAKQMGVSAGTVQDIVRAEMEKINRD
ncbi:MAG: GntR family transcriptional regulator [Planctomycetota bacterium]